MDQDLRLKRNGNLEKYRALYPFAGADREGVFEMPF
jgi:hypothetical protein